MVKGMKQTEIGWIPEDWEVNPLYTLVSKIASGKSNTSHYPNEQFPIYGSTGIIGTKNYYDYEGEKITVARVGANAGHLNLINGYYCISDNTLFIKVNDRIKIEYLHKYLQSINLNQYVFGSGQPLITGTILKNLIIPLPPLPEQEVIAGALSDADAWIESLEQLIAKKRLIKQGAMQELLTPKEGWEVKKLGEVGEIITGGTPSTLVAEYWSGDIPWITPTDINIKKDIYVGERNLTVSGLSQIRKLRKNSLLVTCIASIGKNAILRVDGACNQQINAITPNANFSVNYLYYLLELNKNILIGKAGTTATLILSKAEFSLIEFLFPSLTEQTRIATILSDMDAELEALEQQLHKARQIKQGMMQELLTGRIRLNYDASDGL